MPGHRGELLKPKKVGRTSECERKKKDLHHLVVSTLACGLSNGDVILIDVAQKVSPGSPFYLKVTTQTRGETVASLDKRIITAMKWISGKDGTVSDPVIVCRFTAHFKQPMLVYCKPGTVHMYTAPSLRTSWSGLTNIRLENQMTSWNSSEIHPCCGIEYNHENDSVILAIADGSLHVVGDINGTPRYVSSSEVGLSSHGLSTLARNLFLRNEGRGITEGVTGKISGMTSILNGSILLWLFE